MFSVSADNLIFDTTAQCPICGETSTLLLSSRDADVFACKNCSHVFSRLRAGSSPEEYGSDYYDRVHANWFSNPNIGLFEWVYSNFPEKCSSALDVGCGKGAFLRFVRKRSPVPLELVGIDYSQNPHESGISYRAGDFEKTDDLGTFDMLVSLAVIEHLDSPVSFVRHLRKHCKTNSRLAVMTLNNDSLLYVVARLLAVLGIKAPINRLYSAHHLQHYTNDSLEATLESGGFEIVKVHKHNVPLNCFDVPIRNKWLRKMCAIVLGLLFLSGTVAGRTYLQTVIARPV